RVRFPAAAPILYRLRVSTRPSLQNSAYSGRHGGSLPFFFWGRGRQAMHLLRKQVDVGALPTDSTISLRETRPMHREKPHKLLQVGVTPTPATILRLEPKRPRGFQAKDVLHRPGEGGL